VGCGARTAEIGGDSWDIGCGEGRLKDNKKLMVFF